MLGRVGEGGEEGADRREGALAVARTPMLEPDAVYRVAHWQCQPLAERGRIVRGVRSRRQWHDPHGETVPHRELHSPERRVLAGRVRVEAEEEPLRQTRELPQLS